MRKWSRLYKRKKYFYLPKRFPSSNRSVVAFNAEPLSQISSFLPLHFATYRLVLVVFLWRNVLPPTQSHLLVFSRTTGYFCASFTLLPKNGPSLANTKLQKGRFAPRFLYLMCYEWRRMSWFLLWYTLQSLKWQVVLVSTCCHHSNWRQTSGRRS